MTLAERVLAFAAQAPDLQTRQALGQSFLTLIEPLGATRYVSAYLRRHNGELIIDQTITNLPRLWGELYLERNYEAVDPVFRAVARDGMEGYWSDFITFRALGRQGREIVATAARFDMRDGFARRISLQGGGLAVMMAAGRELSRHPDARAAFRMSFDIFANEGARMLKLAEAERDSRAGETRELSQTQLRVLLMRAEGLSNRQVAEALGRHEKTIECHITEILRRLKARNMIDAIRIATKLNLIV